MTKHTQLLVLKGKLGIVDISFYWPSSGKLVLIKHKMKAPAVPVRKKSRGSLVQGTERVIAYNMADCSSGQRGCGCSSSERVRSPE